jgi:PhnB protein
LSAKILSECPAEHRPIVVGLKEQRNQPNQLQRKTDMTHQVKPIPEGFHTVTPHLIVKGAAEAIAFYKKAFGAEELSRLPAPDGKLMHASVKIGDSIVFLMDEAPQWKSFGPETLGGTPVVIHLYVDNVDAAFERAVTAGGNVKLPPTDMFWGDRYCQVNDPFGYTWSLASHKEDVTPDQVAKNAEAMFAKGGCGDT